MKKQLKSFAFAVLAGAVITSCADSASINQEAASSYTQEMGKIRSQGAIDTTSNTARRIHHVFNKMVPYANQENETGLKFNWQINVIKSKELNAWAMPGGKMAFYTGLVDTLQLNDNEIAVVISHIGSNDNRQSCSTNSASNRTHGAEVGFGFTVLF